MAGKDRSAIQHLPTRAELGDIVKKLAYFDYNVRELERYSNTNALRPPLSALAPREFSSDDDVKTAWDTIQKLPAHRKLSKDPNFTEAVDAFRKAINPSRYEEARFLMAVAFYVHHYIMETEQPELVKHPDKRTRTRVAAAARMLRHAAKEGARLENVQAQSQLEALLTQLEAMMGRKPPRQDDTYLQRRFVKRLAMSFLSSFDQSLTTTLSSLAAIIGYEPDERNIERIVSEAQREHKRKQLSDAVAQSLPP